MAGLPDIRVDHAIAMARFATDCLDKFQEVVQILEVELGPDTADLGLRTGMHTGPVTAGVLRGERARFQLFGDTVNTTARIESLGQGGRIHLSEECAEELIAFDKAKWVIPRDDKVSAKGKGELNTYWLNLKEEDSIQSGGTISSSEAANQVSSGGMPLLQRTGSKTLASHRPKSESDLAKEKNQRLIEWNTERLKQLLGLVVAQRTAPSTGADPHHFFDEGQVDRNLRKGRMVFDEVAEIINLPNYNKACPHGQDGATLSPVIVQQIRKYVSAIALLYPDNPFHNFDHASHVAMSVSKLLSRIVAPKMEQMNEADNGHELQRKIHDHTYGITSDPLTQVSAEILDLSYSISCSQPVPYYGTVCMCLLSHYS